MRVIIIGAGVVGYTIAEKLSKEAQDVVLIEENERRVREVQEALDVRIILGSGSSPKVLHSAGLQKSDLLIAVANSDEVNMIACLIAGTQARVPKKIARIRNPEYIDYNDLFTEENLDLDLNISPERVAAERILNILEYPGAIEVDDFAEGSVKLVGYRLRQGSPLIGRTLVDFPKLNPLKNILVVAIYRGDDTLIPDGNTVFKEGDLVFSVTLHGEVKGLLGTLGATDEGCKKVMIVGGGNIGLTLAKALEEDGYKVKIIERDNSRAEHLAEDLSKAIVICGDGTDKELLMEENISDIDTFISVTNDEEANILTSLLSKRLGVKRCITLIDKPEYLSMVPTIGIDVAVSPRISSVSGILRFVRRGKVLSVTPLHEERVEALETVALETSDIAGKSLENIKLPRGAKIGAVIKGDEAIIPHGDTVIDPGDKVIIFALREQIRKVEKALMVKPEFF